MAYVQSNGGNGGTVKNQDGFSLVEVMLASTILIVAFLGLLQMLIIATKGIQGNKVRSLAQSEAIYGVEQVKATAYSSIPTTPLHQYITQSATRGGIQFSRYIHYQITDSNHDSLYGAGDYVIATVTVTWTTPTPVKPVVLTVYKVP